MQTRKSTRKTLYQHTLKTLITFLSLLSTAAPFVKNESRSSGVTSFPEELKVPTEENSEEMLEYQKYYHAVHKYSQVTHKPDNRNMTLSHIISNQKRFISSQEDETLPESSGKNATNFKFPKVSTKILKDLAKEETKNSNEVSPTLFPDTFQPVTWPLTNRERYLTTSGPFVLLNNHRPPSYLSHDNKNVYHWLLRPVSSSTTESLDSNTATTFPDFLITRPTTATSLEELDDNTAPTYVTSNLSFEQEDSQDPLARPTALVHTNLMIAQKPFSEAKTGHPNVKPTKKMQITSASTPGNKQPNTKESTTITTKRPSSVTTRLTKMPYRRTTTPRTTTTETAVVPWSDSENYHKSPTSAGNKRPSSTLQPVTSTWSALVANLLRSSILGTFLLMIPSAFLAMMLL